MTVVIGIPASAEDETRSPITGDVVKKLAALGARVLVQRGATDAAFSTPESLGDVDWAPTSAEVIAGSDIVWSIGNLSDASPRLLEILRTADVLAVEDTRTLHRLAAGLNVHFTGRVMTHHEHNENERVAEILDLVRAGNVVAVLSDAGMPTVSDPGFPLTRAAAEAGLRVTVIPGPSAVLAALAVSGLPTDRFTFEGFLPRKVGERATHLKTLAEERRTMVFYESPHRLAVMLEALRDALGGDRQAVVCRELTKLHEEVLRDDLAGLTEWAQNNQVRGEIAVVVHGAAAAEAPEPEDLVGAHG